MKYQDKKTIGSDAAAAQAGNRSWWTDHTMSYDWKNKSGLAPFSLPWYDEIDRRFLRAAHLFSPAANPFDELMAAGPLRGKRVLEIGCGMGFHSELLTRAGAQLTSIDLSPTSVQATRTRLDLKELPSDVRQMDAEKLDFPSGTFDMVWSWGVIHHSSRTGRIVREIERVLKPGGTARIMVYNLEGMPAFVTLATRYLTGFWRGRSLDELLWQSTDGFSARFYTRDSLGDLLLTFFETVDLSVLGQEADAMPLPRALRRWVLKLVPVAHQRAVVRRRGAYLFAVATKHE
jgi:2-polyprenyl-3-methyl-5-hydroxy-6-metoxy-1,4-benzoquinol methylase